MTTIHIKLRQLRRAKNLSQEELAKRLGISRQAVIAIEQGESLPSLPVILAILRALEIPFDHLFQGEWKPFRPFAANEEAYGDLHLSRYHQSAGSQQIPLRLEETPISLIINAELPGVCEEDLTVDLGSQHCIIMAIKRPFSTNGGALHSNECVFGPLLRIISLPAPIDTNEAQAKFKNGVLTLTLPKHLPDTKRRITFKKTSPDNSGSK